MTFDVLFPACCIPLTTQWNKRSISNIHRLKDLSYIKCVRTPLNRSLALICCYPLPLVLENIVLLNPRHTHEPWRLYLYYLQLGLQPFVSSFTCISEMALVYHFPPDPRPCRLSATSSLYRLRGYQNTSISLNLRINIVLLALLQSSAKLQ